MTQAQEAVFYQGHQKRIDYTPSGVDIACGEIVPIGTGLVGVCTDPEGISDGVLGALAISGVFKIKKDAIDTFAAGAVVAWDDTTGQAEPNGGVADDFSVGQAVEAAVAADDHVKVNLNKNPVT